MLLPTDNPYQPCPCGSGKKYKFCCLPEDRKKERQSRLARREKYEHTICFDEEDLTRAEEMAQRASLLARRGKFKDASPLLQQSIRLVPFVPQPYNNLAICYFGEGNLTEAIATEEKVLREIDKANIFAMSALVHYYLLAGRDEEAKEIVNRLIQMQPNDEFAAAKMCEALARLKSHLQIYQTGVAWLFKSDECRSDIAYFTGLAAANLGRTKQAIHYLSLVNKEPLKDITQEYLNLLQQQSKPNSLDGDWPYLIPAHWLPIGISDPEDLLKNMEKTESIETKQSVLFYLARASLDTVTKDEKLLQKAIHLLGEVNTPQSRAVLNQILQGTWGTDQIRLEAFYALQEVGEIIPRQKCRIFLNNEWTEVVAFQSEITVDAGADYEMPPQAIEVAEKAFKSLVQDDWAKSAELFKQLAEMVPDYPPASYNRALALLQLGKESEAESIIVQIIQQHPEYLFARCLLTELRLQENRLTEAKEIIRESNLHLLPQIHPAAYCYWFYVQAKLAIAEKQFDEAKELLQNALKIKPPPDLRKEFKRLQSYITVVKKIERELKKIDHTSPRDDNFIPLGTVIDYGQPLPDEAFFAQNEPHEISAARLIYSVLLKPEVERVVSKITNRLINRGREELKCIETAKDTETLIGIMKNNPDPLNHSRLISKLIKQKTQSVPMILQELKQSQPSSFVELAVKILHQAKINCSNEIIDIIKSGHNRSAYAISILCLLLGFYDHELSEKLLWDYYHYLKSRYPNDTYSDGPLLGLIEIDERRKDSAR